MNPAVASPPAPVKQIPLEGFKSLWTDIVLSLESEISRPMLITWFMNTTVLGREDGTLIVGLPIPMFLNWHLEHYKDQTLGKAQQIDPSIQQIVYKVDISLRDDAMRTIDILKLFPAKPKARKLPNKPEVTMAGGLRSRILNERYTLDSFVVGPSNRLAHAACQAVASDPGGKYNPLFIYGGVGLGKTHLLQAVGNALLQRDPNATVLYTTSEEFTNQFIESIAGKKMEQLRKRYRQVDMLIIDDVQFFASKDRCQEEFFHTFNTLLHAGKQVVISSDKPPQELHDVLQPRLRSRFERGMIADVQMPDFETRVAILSERAKEFEIMLDREVIHFIAKHVCDSVRTLEGILMQAVAQYDLEHRIPTVHSIGEIMQKLAKDPYVNSEPDVPGFELPGKRAVTFEDVLERVSGYYSVSIQDIMGDARTRNVLIPRQVAMYIASRHLKCSSVRIGKLFGGRDHSTVLHAISKIDRVIRTDPQLIREINTIIKETGL